MHFRRFLFAAFLVFVRTASAQVTWPDGTRAAVSLSFDDARSSQIEKGLPLFARYGATVTFYVVPPSMEAHLEGWRQAVEDGHEIGNHSMRHPCTGNFTWSREKALETYSLEQMRDELTEANLRIEELLGVSARVFAYPCGQTFVGRGSGTESYVPLVAELFLSGRGWLDEVANDPAFADPAQLTGVPMDDLEFDQILPLLEAAREEGRWLVLAGHDVGESGHQTTRVSMLEQLLQYVDDPAHQIWLAPVGTVTEYVLGQRTQ